MGIRGFVAIGLGLAAALTAGAVALNGAGGPEPAVGQGAGQQSVAGTLPSPSKTGPSASAPNAEAPSPKATGSTARAKAAPAGPALEVLPPVKKAGAGLPESKKRAPVVSGKLPKTASKHGSLVKGFPKDAVPVPDGAKIVTSSVAAQGRVLQVGLEASSKLSAQRILETYKADFEDKGWLYTAAPAADGAQAIRGGFEGDSVTVTVRTSGTGATILSVFAVFHAAG